MAVKSVGHILNRTFGLNISLIENDYEYTIPHYGVHRCCISFWRG